MSDITKHTPADTALRPAGQYLTFVLKGQTYAIGILAIKEIIENGHMTPVPMMPASIRGVINLRGAVVPVIDLGVQFSAGTTQITRRSCIVIVEVAHGTVSQDVGILVDAVNEVMEIAASDIEPSPSFGTSIRTDFIAGMGRIGDRFVIILEPERVLSVEDMAIAQAAAHQPGAANDPASKLAA